jgi:hypothetical protein
MNAPAPAIPVHVKPPTRMKPVGQGWATYEEVVPAGVSLETVMSIAWWGRTAANLKPLDVIHAVAEDGSFDVDIRLIAKSSTAMTFRLLRESVIANPAPIRRESKAGTIKVIPSGEGSGIQGGRIERSRFAVKNMITGQILSDGLRKDEADAERRRILGPDADDD